MVGHNSDIHQTNDAGTIANSPTTALDPPRVARRR